MENSTDHGDQPILTIHQLSRLTKDLKFKEDLLNDLDRFLKRRKFYRRVGKAWK